MKKLHKITKLKRRRVEMGISQAILGTKVGVAVSSIGGYERGENPVSAAMVNLLCQALESSQERLFRKHPKLTNKYIAK